MKDKLGNRMKTYYEEVSRTKLVRRMPVIIRLDGKSFHTFTRGFVKPFDEVFMNAMHLTMRSLCENIQGCVLGYTQSDEITLVLTDYAKLTTSAWFDYEVQKMCSVSASMATLYFNQHFRDEVNRVTCGKTTDEMPKEWISYFTARDKGAVFDSRCFNVPKEEVTNCIRWRQQDAERNSVNSLAQSLYSHQELQGIGVNDLIGKMGDEKGVFWGDLPVTKRRGSCCIKIKNVKDADIKEVSLMSDGNFSIAYEVKDYSTEWYIDNNIPKFVNEGRMYIESRIRVEEE